MPHVNRSSWFLINDNSIQENKERKSSLLGLPAEILREIFTLVLGGRLIHLKYYEAASCLASLEAGTPCIWTCVQHGFHNTICNAEKTEAQAYNSARFGCLRIPDREDRNNYVQTHHARHRGCFERLKDTSKGQADSEEPESIVSHSIDVSLLRVCRQTYQETFYLLHSTNTFAFADPYTFKKFTESLNTPQKSMLTKLHFGMTWGKPKPTKGEVTWPGVFPQRLISSLTDLTSITLCFNVKMHDREEWLPEEEHNSQGLDSYIGSGLLRFCQLPLKSVRVMISDPRKELDPNLGRNVYKSRYTLVQKRGLSCYYELRLRMNVDQDNIIARVEQKLDHESKRRIAMFVKAEKMEQGGVVDETDDGDVSDDEAAA